MLFVESESELLVMSQTVTRCSNGIARTPISARGAGHVDAVELTELILALAAWVHRLPAPLSTFRHAPRDPLCITRLMRSAFL
jgi:hypothetical protein